MSELSLSDKSIEQWIERSSPVDILLDTGGVIAKVELLNMTHEELAYQKERNIYVVKRRHIVTIGTSY